MTTNTSNYSSTSVFLVGVAYVCMYIAQSRGAQVIELLHGRDAMVAATAAQYDDVQADTPLELLCRGYDSHHFDAHSNCSHAVGMVLVLITLFHCVYVQRRWGMLLTVPPVWYLYAWAGHFFIQKDIPAVFVYGMSLRGWLAGEYCSLCSLFAGRTVAEPWELLLTAGIVGVHMFMLFPSSASSPKQHRKVV